MAANERTGAGSGGDAAAASGTPARPRLAAPRSHAPKSHTLWRRAFVGLTLGLILGIVVGFLVIIDRLTEIPGDIVSGGRELATGAANAAMRIAEAFRTGVVETSFLSYATEVSGSSLLQFATLDQTEIIERTDSASLLWGRIELPDVMVEARIPVRYSYTLDLEDEWRLTLEDATVHVLAPAVRPNRPAVDTSAIEYRVRADSVLRDEDAVLDQLRLDITDHLAERADENIDLVRETGRRKTADFARAFLLSQFGEDADDYRIVVRFRDEPESPPAVPEPAPARPQAATPRPQTVTEEVRN